jgi:hypothetical protein
MKDARTTLYLTISILLGLPLLGCGSSGFVLPEGSSRFIDPQTAIAPTSNPLVAQYSIAGLRPGYTAWVEFGTDTNYGRQTSTMPYSVTNPSSQTLRILVAGMKAETTYHMRAHVDSARTSWVDQDHTFTTGALPGSQPPPQISVTAPVSGLAPWPGVELLSLVKPPSTTELTNVVTDLQGNVIWFCPFGGVPINPMPNGHFILNLYTDLLEIDLACNRIRDVSLAQVNQSLQTHGYSFDLNTFHHDMLVLPNGHWIALAQITKDFTDLPGYPGTIGVLGDVLIDIDPNGNVVWVWSAFDHLDVNRHLQGLPDWTHSNALVYLPDGNLLLSMRHQSWILKIDYRNGTGSGDVLWRLGEDGNFTLLDGGDPSQWFYAQHDPVLLSANGAQMILAIWDNGNLRIDSNGVACGSTSTAPACYSRATVFQVDESTTFATLQWQDLPGFYSFWGGSIDRQGNGDIEFDMTDPFDSDSSQIMEVTQTDSPQTVWQMNITGANAYRGYRIPSLYPGVAWQQ